MADANLTNLTEATTPDGSDLKYRVIGAASDRKMYAGSDNLLPDGYIINGELSVTVSSNNLTVALKTRSGGNPSATDPVSVWINGTFRRCTASLSVTKNAATNWFNSGGAELATKETDYFVYLLWNTTATDIMDIGFARIPYGRVYSDFSGTTTNERYLAFANASTPTSTDDCVVIGRFAATLSAGAGYTWTVPTFTNTNLIHTPIYETRILDYVPTRTGYSSNPSAGQYRYRVVRDDMEIDFVDTGNGTSNATTKTITLPFTPGNSNTYSYQFRGFDNGAKLATPSLVTTASGSGNVATLYKDFSEAVWTGSGNHRVIDLKFSGPLR